MCGILEWCGFCWARRGKIGRGRGFREYGRSRVCGWRRTEGGKRGRGVFWGVERLMGRLGGVSAGWVVLRWKGGLS